MWYTPKHSFTTYAINLYIWAKCKLQLVRMTRHHHCETSRSSFLCPRFLAQYHAWHLETKNVISTCLLNRSRSNKILASRVQWTLNNHLFIAEAEQWNGNHTETDLLKIMPLILMCVIPIVCCTIVWQC